MLVTNPSSPRKRELRDSSFPRKRESIWCRPISCCHRIQRPITWIPAFAGMTTDTWIPALAGMTNYEPAFAGMTTRCAKHLQFSHT